MAKAKKYGTLTMEDGTWTRTLSKTHKDFPISVSEGIKEAYQYIINRYKDDENVDMKISSYQEIIPHRIMEHLFLRIRIYDHNLRRELYKDIMEKCRLFPLSSNHASKYLLHDKERYGKYGDYPEGVMSIVEFIF